jgi:PPOX class probable F420-dependent enzyme
MNPSSLDLSQPSHVRADVRLRNEPIAWLGTVRPDGRPHFVPVWFLWDQATVQATVLVFSKNDQKIRNLRGNKHVVLALDNTESGDNVVVIEGEATLLEHGSVTPALPAYTEKYAIMLAQFGLTGESMGQEYTEAIRITPTVFRVYSPDTSEGSQ